MKHMRTSQESGAISSSTSSPFSYSPMRWKLNCLVPGAALPKTRGIPMSKARFDTRNFEKYAMSVLQEFYCRDWSCFRYGPGWKAQIYSAKSSASGVEVTEQSPGKTASRQRSSSNTLGIGARRNRKIGIASACGRIMPSSPRETASMSLRFTWIPCKTPSAPKPKNLTASIGFLSRTTSISLLSTR